MAIHVPLETYDRYVRSVAEIKAETKSPGVLTVEALMAYGLAVPSADELISGFIQGEHSTLSPSEQYRQLVDRDSRRLELESPIVERRPPQRLDRTPSTDNSRESDEAPWNLENFIAENPEIHRQIRASDHKLLVRWVMLHLMEAAHARRRIRRVTQAFETKSSFH